jgi:hypothetical protein
MIDIDAQSAPLNSPMAVAHATDVRMSHERWRAEADAISAWPAWEDRVDRAFAMGRAYLIAEVQHLKRCIESAERIGTRPDYFLAQLKRLQMNDYGD